MRCCLRCCSLTTLSRMRRRFICVLLRRYAALRARDNTHSDLQKALKNNVAHKLNARQRRPTAMTTTTMTTTTIRRRTIMSDTTRDQRHERNERSQYNERQNGAHKPRAQLVSSSSSSSVRRRRTGSSVTTLTCTYARRHTATYAHRNAHTCRTRRVVCNVLLMYMPICPVTSGRVVYDPICRLV